MSYTKLGFSIPFSCCSYWDECNYGKGQCHYKEIDPETMESCRCYQRNQGKSQDNISLIIEKPKETRIPVNQEEEQLSLF